MLDLTIVRFIFVLVLTASGYLLHPFQDGPSPWTALAGLILGVCIIFFEVRLEQVSLKRLIGAAFGSVLGIIGAFFMSLVLRWAQPEHGSSHVIPFIQVCLLLWMTYVGLIVGAKKGDLLNLAALGGLFGAEKESPRSVTRFWIPA